MIGAPLDLVFNIAEGLRGRTREAQIPALLDLLGVPFTGSDAAAMAVTLDKGLAKRLVREAGLPTPAWEVGMPLMVLGWEANEGELRSCISFSRLLSISSCVSLFSSESLSSGTGLKKLPDCLARDSWVAELGVDCSG